VIASVRLTGSIQRISTIAFGTYREAVRTRLMLGVFALGLATCIYSLVVAAMSAHNEERVVADLGAASASLFGIVISIVLGSTSLYREIEYRTVFPILSRPIHRWEYLVGKYVGIVLTVVVFVGVDTGVTLLLLTEEAGIPSWKIAGVTGVFVASLVASVVWLRRASIFVVIPWSLAFALMAWSFASGSTVERQLVTASAALAVLETGIIAAVATLFSAFSSPFLTATCTFMVVVIGRSADSLAHLPRKLFGSELTAFGKGLAHLVPNLHVYVPARSLLLGQVVGERVWPYVGMAAAQAVAYATALLVIGSLAFRRRDFS
jgi:hypothetical protein